MNLNKRYLAGELMDDPELAAKDHHQALLGLRRVNLFSGTAKVIAKTIIEYCKNENLLHIRVLDLACGGGDVTVQVAKLLSQANLVAEVYGWDISENAIDFARRQLEVDNVSTVQFEVVNALDGEAKQKFDFVYCTLFLHHLSNEDAGRLLSGMWKMAGHLVLIDDLRRTTFGYWLAVLGCRLLSRSPIVHNDGPLSVRAAFTELEIQELSDRSELPRPNIRRHWPHRFLLTWAARK